MFQEINEQLSNYLGSYLWDVAFCQCPLFIVFGLIETEVTVINRGTGRKKYVLQEFICITVAFFLICKTGDL